MISSVRRLMLTSMRQLVLSLLALSPLLLALYILAGFPHPPNPPVVHPSLASLPPSCPSWSVYPEDYYHGGSYVMFPHGRVRSDHHYPWKVADTPHRRDTGSLDQRMARGFEHPPSRYSHSSHSRILQVVLIHGLSIPAIVWKDVAPVLASRGYRVLLYGNAPRTRSTARIDCLLRSLWPWLLRRPRRYL